jgi:hypothetical protein
VGANEPGYKGPKAKGHEIGNRQSAITSLIT